MTLPDISQNKRIVGKLDYYLDGDEIVGMTTQQTFRMSRAEIQTIIDTANEQIVFNQATIAKYQAILEEL
jgi:hypothetical protein